MKHVVEKYGIFYDTPSGETQLVEMKPGETTLTPVIIVV